MLSLSLGIFYFLVKDQKVKTDILRTTLELFGEQLLDTVPGGEPKLVLQQKFDDFLQKADKDDIAPEYIEQVAANILNLTTMDSVVSIDMALGAFEVEPEFLTAPKLPPSPELKKLEISERPLKIFKKNRQGELLLEKPERDELARQLRDLHELSLHIRKTSKHDSAYKDVQNQLLFLADSGLKVAMSIELKETIPKEALVELQKKLQRLERDKMVEWREDIRTRRIILVESLLDLDEFDEYMCPSQFLAGRGTFRFIKPATIDSLATANPDSFKSLLKLHLEQLKAHEKRRGPQEEDN